MLGFRRALPQLAMAGLFGAGLMLLADWCGRMLAFPDQLPAGLMATFLGAPYFIWYLAVKTLAVKKDRQYAGLTLLLTCSCG